MIHPLSRTTSEPDRGGFGSDVASTDTDGCAIDRPILAVVSSTLSHIIDTISTSLFPPFEVSFAGS